MKTANLSGMSGVDAPGGNVELKNWKVPVILSLSAAAVIGLLLLGLHQRTEAKLLQMQYMVQTAQDDANGRVRTAQRELAGMTVKVREMDAKMVRMQSELTRLQQMSREQQVKSQRNVKVNDGHRKPKPHRGSGGLEDLSSFGADVRLTEADDDPSTGFKKGELL
ncbi:MAG: hypothetical protein JXX14_15015 [Deltaproteobacteria bacterium]|nr:hypothetical protein [Deltaproteobacteria bacterium]